MRKINKAKFIFQMVTLSNKENGFEETIWEHFLNVQARNDEVMRL